MVDKNSKSNTISYVIIALIVIAVVVIVIQMGGKDEDTSATPQQSPVSTASSPPVVPVYELNQDAIAGTFTYNVSKVAVTDVLKSEAGETKTEDQFVIVTLKITNGDSSARDISANAFALRDQSGNTYEALERSTNVGADEPLYYETINPGLSRTRVVIFETPKGISGLTLIADSGVTLAGGEHVEINLE